MATTAEPTLQTTKGPTTAKGWGTDAPDQPLRPMEFERRALRAVAVGTVVDADLTCRECLAGWEQFCLSGATFTYNGRDKIDGTITKGGYSDHIVVREHFVFRVPESLNPSAAAPLLCAGITTWS